MGYRSAYTSRTKRCRVQGLGNCAKQVILSATTRLQYLLKPDPAESCAFFFCSFLWARTERHPQKPNLSMRKLKPSAIGPSKFYSLPGRQNMILQTMKLHLKSASLRQYHLSMPEPPKKPSKKVSGIDLKLPLAKPVCLKRPLLFLHASDSINPESF